MSQKLIINVDNASDLLSTSAYGAGALLRLERSTSPTSGFVEIATIALVSTTLQYEAWDSTGSSSHYYRTRVSNSGNTVVSAYSDVFQAGSIAAYATLDDVLETMSVVTNDTRAYNLLSDLLVDASDLISQICGRDFYRHPQVSGTEVVYYHVVRSGQRSLMRAIDVPIDIVSITTLEVASSTGGTYTAIAAGSAGWYYEPQNPKSGWPYSDVLLSSIGSIGTFPVGEQIVRLTGVRGWASVPALVKRATIDLAREWYRQGPGGGGPVGISALGQPIFGPGTPPTVRSVHEQYQTRSYLYA